MNWIDKNSKNIGISLKRFSYSKFELLEKFLNGLNDTYKIKNKQVLEFYFKFLISIEKNIFTITEQEKKGFYNLIKPTEQEKKNIYYVKLTEKIKIIKDFYLWLKINKYNINNYKQGIFLKIDTTKTEKEVTEQLKKFVCSIYETEQDREKVLSELLNHFHMFDASYNDFCKSLRYLNIEFE